ncbi:hypothetical protein CEV31_2387 [Brucella thiophenivorans]|uniref:Uncharacterized protein n=1 Tax=Brucella thiophenivorans TaxID=571255 RepID=A0A256FVZ1_9HYPH|nr:hypothetical protein CEV31_2387 [Brucella thiophenivorans]
MCNPNPQLYHFIKNCQLPYESKNGAIGAVFVLLITPVP